MSLTGLLPRLVGEARTPQEIRDAVYLFGEDTGSKQSRFWLLLVLATAIATAGVVGDSTATVIGAMIIAPLAVPIQGVAVAIAYGELTPLLRSAATLAAAVLVVVLLAAGIAVLLPELKPIGDNSQVTGRISPTLVDLAAAVATGFAGAFAVGRRDIGDILPGVAIAISLVPPLAVVGVAAVAADWSGALGAFLLFVTNVLAIVVAGVLLFSALRVTKNRRVDPAFHARPVYAVVGVSSIVVVAALSVFTYRAVDLANRQAAAKAVAGPWAKRYGEQLQQVRYNGSDLTLVVVGTTDGAQDRQLPSLLHDAMPAGTTITVDRIVGSRDVVGRVGE